MQEQHHYRNTVLMAAYSGLMFFGLLVERQLSSARYNEEEIAFVRGWCRVGNFSLEMLILVIIFSILLMQSGFERLLPGVILLSAVVLCIQIAGMILIACGEGFESRKLEVNPGQRLQLFKAFLPGVGSFIWFRKHNYQAPTWRYKESQLRWALVFFALIVSNTRYLPAVVLSLLAIRVCTLIFGLDCISQRRKQALHLSYKIYVEELLLSIPLLIQKIGKSEFSFSNSLSSRQNIAISSGFFLSWKWRGILLVALALSARWGRYSGLRWKRFALLGGIWRMLLIGSSPLILTSSKA